MDCPIPQTELDEIYAFATDLARKAGQLLLERVNDRNSEQVYAEKENAVDLVTQTDEDVESLIKTAIQTKYPAHKFLGEESYAKGQSREYLIDEQPTWCVDPLDGTVNFTHAFPMFCVSIGFIVNHYPVIGVIYAPMLNQLFSSCLNRGAWLNEMQQLPLIRKPSIPPLPATAPSKCIFACEWGKDRRDIPDGTLQRKIESFVNMAAERGSRGGKGGMVHGVRSLGSATMDLAYTAMGSVDIWWRKGVAAAAIALAYLLHKSPYVFPVIGCRTVEQLEANITSLGVELSDEEIYEIEDTIPFDVGFPMAFLFESPQQKYRSDMTTRHIWQVTCNARIESVPKPRPIEPKQGYKQMDRK